MHPRKLLIDLMNEYFQRGKFRGDGGILLPSAIDSAFAYDRKDKIERDVLNRRWKLLFRRHLLYQVDVPLLTVPGNAIETRGAGRSSANGLFFASHNARYVTVMTDYGIVAKPLAAPTLSQRVAVLRLTDIRDNV
jgi:hypothetical protein